MTPILETKNLRHIYSEGTPFEQVALHDVNFYAEPGEFIGLIGHTGSGKSTLIQHLNGLLVPDGGEIFYCGENIHKSKEFTRSIRFRVGLVFQYPEYQLFEETIYQDIAFGPKNMGLSREEIDRRVREAAAFVQIPEQALQKSPFDLSGGQKRRAAIAGVIAMEPEVLILDEPTAGLDPAGRQSLMENIMAYRAKRNATIIMVSHSMEEIASTADRLYVMSHGTVAMTGRPQEIFDRTDELIQIGLDVPQITTVFHQLRALGADVPNVYTIDQALRVLLSRKGGIKEC